MYDISVSMCVYYKDNPNYFELALASILDQSLKPKEVVIVVDGPIPDKTNSILIKYQYLDIIKIIRLGKNVGHGNARRIGLQNCSNEIIALMDADDISLPERFEKQIEILRSNKNLSVIGSNVIEFEDKISNRIGIRKVPENDRDIKKYLRNRCPFNQQTVMMKKSDVIKAGGYLDWYNNEDYYLWLRLYLNNCEFYNIQESLVLFRTNDRMYKQRGGIKYFYSEYKLQKYMLNNKIINVTSFLYNIFIRFIIQIILPNKIRKYVYRNCLRVKSNE